MKQAQISIDITAEALKQIELLLENDYTLEASSFRLTIGGKGCEGFTYQLGFDSEKKGDIKRAYLLENSQSFELLLDAFSAYYCKEGVIDFKRNLETGEEGFIFTNANEREHFGKFFKDQTKVPDHLPQKEEE